MANTIIHDDWLNENSNRKYPFFDEASLVDASGTMTIPNDLIVDLIFPVHALSYDVTLFHVQQITVFNSGVIITIGYNGTAIATRTITDAEHTPYATYYIEGRGDFADSVGRISIGNLANIKKYGGAYTFSTANARLLPTVMRPSLRGVTSVRVVNADGEFSDYLQGDIELIPGANIQFEVISGSPNKIKISAVSNPDFEVGCNCPDASPAPCIKTINNVPPDNAGNFTLADEGCLTIEAITNGLKLTDTCAEPCCGCAETDVLRQELNRLGAQSATQRAQAEALLGTVQQLRDVILTSKIGTIVPCN